MFDMNIPDVEVFKEIPGYKVILKAVLKCQIQALVEQLSKQTGEESVLVTACPDDGTLTHLGSEVGKDFLGAHDEIKSQFLGFCFKWQQTQPKTQTGIAEDYLMRKKGPQTQTKRPRLAPYSTARPPRVTSTADVNIEPTETGQTLNCAGHSQNTDGHLQLYNENINTGEHETDGDQNIVTDISGIKTEPGEDDDHMAQGPATNNVNDMTSQDALALFPMTVGDGFQGRNAVNPEDLSGIQSILKAENQSDIERGEGQGHLKTDYDITTDQGQGQLNIKAEPELESKDHSMIMFKTEIFAPKNIDLKERRNRNISRALSKALNMDQVKTDKECGKYLLLSENEIRPFGCHICQKKFKERHHLKYHLRIHSGLRPYKCEVCAKTFTQSSSLNTHKKLHLNEVRCVHCDIHFRNMSDFARHECKGGSV